MNGLTKSELKRLALIRAAADRFAASHDLTDFAALKRMAADWAGANKARKARRETALRTVKFVFAWLPDC